MSGGSGEYRSTMAEGVDKVRLQADNTRISIQYWSQIGLSKDESLVTDASFEIILEETGCAAKLVTSKWKGSFHNGVSQDGVLKNVRCILINGRPLK